jgi:hypothetical protein
MIRFPGFMLGLVVSTAFDAGCASTVDFHTIRSPTAHFERYRSLEFDIVTKAPPGYVSTPQSVRALDYVEERTRQILQSKRYVLFTKEADMIVRIETGRRVQSTSTQLGLPTDLPYYAPNYDEADQPPFHGYLDKEADELVEGTFVIDAFDGRTHELAWHGFAKGFVDRQTVDYGRLGRAVDAVLASFPPSSVERQ